MVAGKPSEIVVAARKITPRVSMRPVFFLRAPSAQFGWTRFFTSSSLTHFMAWHHILYSVANVCRADVLCRLRFRHGQKSVRSNRSYCVP